MSNQLNIAKWAKKTAAKHIKEIRQYIDDGMDKEKALKLVLDGSTLGAGWKSQIKYEIKYYAPTLYSSFSTLNFVGGE